MNYEYIGRIVEAKLSYKDVAMVYRHIEEVEARAIFSECKKYRYRLDISLKDTIEGDAKTVCAIMQNPSVANSEIADKSVQFLEKLIFKKNNNNFTGVRKLIVVNQFAFVQTNDFSGQDGHIGADNNSHISRALEESDIILVAWGSANAYKNRKSEINTMLREHREKTLLSGKSHPSRASYANYVSAYNIQQVN